MVNPWTSLVHRGGKSKFFLLYTCHVYTSTDTYVCIWTYVIPTYVPTFVVYIRTLVHTSYTYVPPYFYTYVFSLLQLHYAYICTYTLVHIHCHYFTHTSLFCLQLPTRTSHSYYDIYFLQKCISEVHDNSPLFAEVTEDQLRRDQSKVLRNRLHHLSKADTGRPGDADTEFMEQQKIKRQTKKLVDESCTQPDDSAVSQEGTVSPVTLLTLTLAPANSSYPGRYCSHSKKVGRHEVGEKAAATSSKARLSCLVLLHFTVRVSLSFFRSCTSR